MKSYVQSVRIYIRLNFENKYSCSEYMKDVPKNHTSKTRGFREKIGMKKYDVTSGAPKICFIGSHEVANRIGKKYF